MTEIKPSLQVLLEKRNIQSIAERMQDYHAIAMVILFGFAKHIF